MPNDHHAFIQIIISVGVSFLFFLIVFTLSSDLIISMVISGSCYLIYFVMMVLMYGKIPPPTKQVDEDLNLQNIQKRRKVIKNVLKWMSIASLFISCSLMILFIFYSTEITLFLLVLGILLVTCCMYSYIYYLSKEGKKRIEIKIKSRR